MSLDGMYKVHHRVTLSTKGSLTTTIPCTTQSLFSFWPGASDMCGKFKRLETIADRKKGMDNDVSMVVDVEEMEIVGPSTFINIIIIYSLPVASCGQKDEELGKMSCHAFPLANMN